jgi:DNA mismatch endonuclease, patch repair protein
VSAGETRTAGAAPASAALADEGAGGPRLDRSDVFDSAKRSAVMRAVKSRDTAPEQRVRAAACAAGFARRYRIGGRGLPGKPDLVFGALGKAVFVHGCFWHGHACKRGARAPKHNAAYWAAKIARNRARDAAVLGALSAAGWSTLVLWECETQDGRALAARLAKFLR